MAINTHWLQPALIVSTVLVFSGCQEKASAPDAAAIAAMKLKRGAVISCSPAEQTFGAVNFENTCSEKQKPDINLAVSLLHSFEYDEAEKVFAKVIDAESGAAIAYWGVAMSNFHPLWQPPNAAELEKGKKAIQLAQSISNTSPREAAYIHALAQFYQDSDTVSHQKRCLRYEAAMEKLHADYPDDIEAALFYALSLDAAADPADKGFRKQQKAGDILAVIEKKYPDHPGVVHYIIHSYDYPPLAAKALIAARKYASVAPSSAHAQHMPSHVFTRLGLWDESIHSNKVASAAAVCYAESAGIKGHWDEELHSMDYLVYAYLQQGNDSAAKEQEAYLDSMRVVSPVNSKVAYAFASIPSRNVLENRSWTAAASLPLEAELIKWNKFPWQKAILHFTRSLGNSHLGKIPEAQRESQALQAIYDTLILQKDVYKANQVMVQINSANAWILLKEGKQQEAIDLMTKAADTEDNTQKLAVTPGEVLPARELLGDMLLGSDKPAEALVAYEANLVQHPNRFNGLYNAGLAAERCKKPEIAAGYYERLLSVAAGSAANRTEIAHARDFLKKKTS